MFMGLAPVPVGALARPTRLSRCREAHAGVVEHGVLEELQKLELRGGDAGHHRLSANARGLEALEQAEDYFGRWGPRDPSIAGEHPSGRLEARTDVALDERVRHQREHVDQSEGTSRSDFASGPVRGSVVTST